MASDPSCIRHRDGPLTYLFQGKILSCVFRRRGHVASLVSLGRDCPVNDRNTSSSEGLRRAMSASGIRA